MPGFNPFRYRFPYTNINDINLDWIIKKVKALSEAVAHIDISRIDEIAQQAETAQQDAETALTTAQSAETTANSVQGIANNALTTAQSAETTANSVQGIANNALTTAQSAETTANSVQGLANTALSTAQSAESTANQAATTAHDASVIADNASYYASSALNVANTKAGKVQNATSGNFAGLDANGDLTDSGHNNSDYAAAAAAVPVGGTTGQVLTKTGATDYAVAWQAPSGGGGDVTADMLAIVVNGNSTPDGAAAGQYVIVKNSTISGVTDGLYTAAQAIPANTAIDATYLTAVIGGGLNDVLSDTKWSALWENASSGSAFAGQPIAVDLSGYDTIKMLIKSSATGVAAFYYDIPNIVGAYISSMIYSNTTVGGNTTMYNRKITLTATGFNVDDAYGKVIGSTDAPPVANSTCIPWFIYGGNLK